MTAYDIVDAQVHLTDTLDGNRILASLDALGINGVIIDEFWRIDDRWMSMPCDELPDGLHRPLSPYARALSLENPERVSYLQRVERRDPYLAEVMTLLGATSGARAVRVVLLSAEDRDAFGNGAFDNVFALAVKHGLAVCVLGPNLRDIPGIIERFPDLRLVLDHCGWARNAEHWQQVLDVAVFPQLSLKWSHTSRAFGRSVEAGTDLASTTSREFSRALDAYGVQRVMWASDITQEEASWVDLLAFVTEHPTLSDGDKQWVLGQTARQIFDWPSTETKD